MIVGEHFAKDLRGAFVKKGFCELGLWGLLGWLLWGPGPVCPSDCSGQ